MLSTCERRGRQNAEDERDEVSKGNHSGVYPVVRGVRTQLSQPRRDDAGARGVVDHSLPILLTHQPTTYSRSTVVE